MGTYSFIKVYNVVERTNQHEEPAEGVPARKNKESNGDHVKVNQQQSNDRNWWSFMSAPNFSNLRHHLAVGKITEAATTFILHMKYHILKQNSCIVLARPWNPTIVKRNIRP